MEYKVVMYRDYDGINVHIDGPNLEYACSEQGHGMSIHGLKMTDADEKTRDCCSTIADLFIQILKTNNMVDDLKDVRNKNINEATHG